MVIHAPAATVQTGTDPVNGRAVFGVVTANGATNLSISNVTVEGDSHGDGTGATSAASFDFVGIAYINSSGLIDHVTTQDFRDPLVNPTTVSGAQHGTDILSTGSGSPLDLEISNSTIQDFQKTGILARNTTVNIHDSAIHGFGAQDIIAQNGIQLSSGSTGSITNNTIDGIGFNPSTNSVAGILAFGADGLVVSGNHFTGTDANDLGLYMQDTSGATVTGNTFDGQTWAVGDYGSHSSENTVTNHGPDGNTYVHIDPNGAAYDLEPSPADTIAFHVDGTAAGDYLEGATGDDSFEVKGGDDYVDGRGGIDTVLEAGTLTTSSFSIVGGQWTVAAEGTDTLVNVEKVNDGNGHHFLLVGDGGYATLQAAIDAASTGDTIVMADGTFAGATVDKALTIVGVNNHGIDASGARGAETVIDGTITVTAATGDVVIDGLKVVNNSSNATQQDGIDIAGTANVTIENTHFYTSSGNANFTPSTSHAYNWGDVAIYVGTPATGHITIDHNLIDGGGTGGFSGASWARALQTETDATTLTITNNTITGNRSGLGFAGLSSTDSITGNTFIGNGTAIAAGATIDLSAITGNTLNGNYDDINVRTSYNGVTLDLSNYTVVDPGPDLYVKVLGTDFNDTITGTAGNDFLTADASTNSDGLNFGAGSTFVDDNTLNGLGGNDILYGSQGIDHLNGGDGNDLMNGGAGADVMAGGKGDDTYVVDTATDSITENANEGNDSVQASVSYTLSDNIENLTLTGSDNINATGNAGNNTLTGNSGANILDGANGADAMAGGAGDDTYVVDNTGDMVTENANEGTDTVQSSVTYTIGANIENLILTGANAINGTGNAGNNTLTGNGAANTLSGGDGNDWIDGGQGTDTMVGGLGDDTFIVDSSTDVVTEAAGAGTDTVRSSVTYTLSNNVENLTLTGLANINAHWQQHQ